MSDVISGIGDFFFGKEAEPSKPFQSARFQEGLDLLEGGVFDAYRQQQAFNQSLARGIGGGGPRSVNTFSGGLPLTLGSQFGSLSGTGRIGGLPTLATKGQIQFPGGPGSAQERFNQTGQLGPAPGPVQRTAPQLGGVPLGFQQAGQQIAGQIGPQTTVSPLLRPTTTGAPRVNFTQRSPFQFDEPRDIGIPDVFTPQFNLAQGRLQEQFAQSEEERLADLNRRGLLTTGATTRAQDLARAERDRRLTDLASQFAIEQGKASLQEEQMQRGLEQQRDFNQAVEIFRQQGASDEQARFLAGQALQAQGQQFQQQLAAQQLRGQQQGQRFREQIGGRQLGLQEEQLANVMRRQPLEDLFRLQLAQMGQIGGTQAQPGALPTAIGAFAGGLGGGIKIPGLS